MKNGMDDAQETDAWWGSYSGWTMVPSTVLCLALTAFIAWVLWRLLSRGWFQLSVVTLAGAVWLIQACRWCYRVFGYNYRVTTRRVFVTRGFLPAIEMHLADLARAEVERGPYHFVANIGNVALIPSDPKQSRVLLEGVAHPRQVAEHLRALSEKARHGAAVSHVSA